MSVFGGNSTDTVQVGPGASIDGIIYIDVPIGARSSSVTFKLVVNGSDGASKVQNITLSVGGCAPSMGQLSYYGLPRLDKESLIALDINNRGLNACKDLTVGFLIDGVLQQRSILARLPTGVNKTVIFSWTPRTAGKHLLTFVVGPQGIAKETNKSNITIMDEVIVPSPDGFLVTPPSLGQHLITVIIFCACLLIWILKDPLKFKWVLGRRIGSLTRRP
jgi:hypothetical protein